MILNRELFVTDCLSGLKNLKGRHLYPHDVERAVAGAIGLDPDRVCAFSVWRAATEPIVVVVETRRWESIP